MGNCKNEDEFFDSFDFLIPELYRVLKNGRLCAVHCKQLARYKTSHGTTGWYDFRGDIIRHFQKFGFVYHSEVVIWTDPVLEMQKTKTQRLLYKQLRSDASHTGLGMPEYLVLFRKWDGDGVPDEPIRHYKNEAEMKADDGDERQIMDLETWQRYASPVWFDIRRTDVLTTRESMSENDEKHICPLQLDVIRRAVQLWTNPDEIVFTPFLGIGSEVYVALEQGRRGIGVELKPQYFSQAVANCQSILNDNQVSLFDEETFGGL